MIILIPNSGYLYYLKSSGLYWSPVITYSTVGALFLITGYDLVKWFFTINFLQKAVIYEHSYKMTSALSAISSAFSGTVFPDYKPYSQFLPSVAGIIYIIITFIFLSKKHFIFKTKSIVQPANPDASRA